MRKWFRVCVLLSVLAVALAAGSLLSSRSAFADSDPGVRLDEVATFSGGSNPSIDSSIIVSFDFICTNTTTGLGTATIKVTQSSEQSDTGASTAGTNLSSLKCDGQHHQGVFGVNGVPFEWGLGTANATITLDSGTNGTATDTRVIRIETP